jgi:hypothetical protein
VVYQRIFTALYLSNYDLSLVCRNEIILQADLIVYLVNLMNYGSIDLEIEFLAKHISDSHKHLPQPFQAEWCVAFIQGLLGFHLFDHSQKHHHQSL